MATTYLPAGMTDREWDNYTKAMQNWTNRANEGRLGAAWRGVI